MRVVAGNPDDRLMWLDTTIPTLSIESRSGIGRATVFPTGATWPERFDVSLDLDALEGFVVRCGSEVHRLELTAAGRVLLEPETSALSLQRSGVGSSGANIVVRIEPGRCAEPARELVIEWVDYYR